MITEASVIRQPVGEGCAPVPSIAFWALKTALLWFALLASAVIASKCVTIDLPQPPKDGPLSIESAFLLVNGLVAIALGLVASRARVSGIGRAVLLFVAMFGISTAMMQIETLYFNESVRMPPDVLVGLVEQSAIISFIVAIVGAFLFRPSTEPVAAVPSNMMTRIALLAVIYVFLYYAAGFFVAWQSEAVRSYYGNGMHIALAPTVAFQIFRGTLWALISLFIVTRLKGSLTSRAAIMAVLFSVLTAAQLLYPNVLVPWPVREMHLIEVGASEAVYGIVATFVLLAGAARHPLSATSPWRLIAGRVCSHS